MSYRNRASLGAAVSRALRKHAGITPLGPVTAREGARVVALAPDHISVSIYAVGSASRSGLVAACSAALNMAGYEYRLARDEAPNAWITVTGRRDTNAEIPADAPRVFVDVVEPGRALVLIEGQQVQARVGREDGRYYVEDTDTEQIIGRVRSYREAGELFARFHLITGPIRVEIDREN